MKYFPLLLPVVVYMSIVFPTSSLRFSSKYVTNVGTKIKQTNLHSTTEAETVTETSEAAEDNSKPKPKVPASAWRFPPRWPFPPDYTELVPAESTIFTKISSPTVNTAMTSHFTNFIANSDCVLELSCANEPILRETGIEKLTHLEITPININETMFSLPYSSASFDNVIIAGGIEYIQHPTDMFREIWRVLRPGGLCFVAFLDKAVDINSAAKLNPLKMWTTMTEEQKIWITGSYFNYSSKFGWNNIEGYDLLASTGADGMKFEMKDSQQENVFVVQATKSAYDHTPPSADTWDEEEVYKYLVSSMQGLRNIGCNSNAESAFNEDCTTLLAHRLTAIYKQSQGTVLDKWAMLNDYVGRLVQIYEILKNVKEVVMPTPVKAMLASYLIDKWEGSEAQRAALSQGVGLVPIDLMDPQSATFWTQLAGETSSLSPRDKITLLGDLIPAMGSGTRTRIIDFPAVLKDVAQALRDNLNAGMDSNNKNAISEADISCVAADLCISDFLYETGDPFQSASRVITFAKTLDKARFDAILSSCLNAPLKV